MKTILTLLMPLLIVMSFLVSSRLFAEASYLSSAFFTIACYCTTSLWILVLSSKKLVLR